MKLLIATPFYQGHGFSAYISSLVNTVQILIHAGVQFDFMAHNGDSYVDRARNTICAKFMESDYTDLLFIDSDLEWNPEAISKLLVSSHEVVGGTYPMKNNWEVFPVGFNFDESGQAITDPNSGMIKADWIMTGFMRIKRSCIEKMVEAYKDMTYQDPGADPVNPERKYIPLFETRLGKGGEDQTFCERWRAIGGEIWLEPNITFGHYGVNAWNGNYHEYLLRQPGGPKYGFKKILVYNFNSVIPDMSNHFDYVNDLEKADAVILWNDVWPEFQEVCEKAKAKNISTFVLWHGIDCGVVPGQYDPCDYSDRPMAADYYLVWSEEGKQHMINRGCSEDRIHIVGCPLYRKIVHKSNGKVVYFPAHDNDADVEAFSVQTWNKIREKYGDKAFVKLLHPENNIMLYEGNKIISDRKIDNHIDIAYQALQNASVMVTDEPGSNVLLAAQLDIPIIKMKAHPRYPLLSLNVFPNVVTEVELDELEKAIRFAINNPKHLRKERTEFAKARDYGNVVENIYKVVIGYINKEL